MARFLRRIVNLHCFPSFYAVVFGHLRLLLHLAHSLGYTATTGSCELSLSSNNRPQTKITISRASKPLGIAPSTGRKEPLLQITTIQGETSVVEDAQGAENYRRTALLPKINLATRYKSTVTPPVGIWLIDKHSPIGRFVPS